MSDIDLSGASVVVTGGSSGIGEAAVRICMQAGARVTFCARDEAGIRATMTRLESVGADMTCVQGIGADVSDPAAVAALFEQARAFGAVTGVIHAAAVLGPIGPLVDAEPREWLRTLEIDLYGSFLVVREAARRMREHGGGRIALFSGGGASNAFPNYTAYACSKVGVVRLTETAAEELRPLGIEINCIAPGFVATRMHEHTLNAGPGAAGEAYYRRTRDELERGGVSADVGARAAAFFVSRAAAGITGKFVSAVHDDWQHWPAHLDDLRESEIFTLRRILPKERGLHWQ